MEGAMEDGEAGGRIWQALKKAKTQPMEVQEAMKTGGIDAIPSDGFMIAILKVAADLVKTQPPWGLSLRAIHEAQ